MNSLIKIKGMSCQHCVMAVKRVLDSLEGVKDTQVNLEKGEAVITHDEPLDIEEVRQRIEKSGYELG